MFPLAAIELSPWSDVRWSPRSGTWYPVNSSIRMLIAVTRPGKGVRIFGGGPEESELVPFDYGVRRPFPRSTLGRC